MGFPKSEIMHLQKFELPKRKTWNKEEYAKRAKERKEKETKEILNLDLDQLKNHPSHTEKRHRGAIIKRDLLRPHKYDVNINDKIGTRKVITESTADSERSGWYCFECKCQLKDSHTYLDHINGKKHQRMLGMSMKTPTSTLQQVRNRLEFHKKRSRNEFEDHLDVAERIQLRKAKEERQKLLRKQAKKRRKIANKQALEDEKYGKIYNHDNNAYKMEKYKKEQDEDDDLEKGKNKNKKKKKKEEIEYVKEAVDPEMAAMGFTFSFGGSKKT